VYSRISLWLASGGADFLIREHKTLPQKALTPLLEVEEIEAGTVFEQTISLTSLEKSAEKVRRVSCSTFKLHYLWSIPHTVRG